MNALNSEIGSPSNGYGRVGMMGKFYKVTMNSRVSSLNKFYWNISGFVTYSDVCWFKKNNIFIADKFDEETCSPYIHSGTEWISYENERSIECKTNYVKLNGFGGVMVFSLNTDDYLSHCYDKNAPNDRFPLVRKVSSILFNNN